MSPQQQVNTVNSKCAELANSGGAGQTEKHKSEGFPIVYNHKSFSTVENWNIFLNK